MVLLDGPAIAAALQVKEQTIRSWATTGKLQRRGRDGRRVLFDLDEAIAVAESSPRVAARILSDTSSTLRASTTTAPEALSDPDGASLVGGPDA